MSEVLSYRDNGRATVRWSKMDRGENYMGRAANGLPISVSDVVEPPSDVNPFDYAFFAPEKDGA